MIYKDERLNLTTYEQSKALRDAGINPNPETWDDETMELASVILDRAQSRKVRKAMRQSIKVKHGLVQI